MLLACLKALIAPLIFTMAEYNGLSRTEAVERMARALYAKYEVMCNSDDCPNDGPTCEGCPIWKKYEEMSSAALDALVGDKK